MVPAPAVKGKLHVIHYRYALVALALVDIALAPVTSTRPDSRRYDHGDAMATCEGRVARLAMSFDRSYDLYSTPLERREYEMP